MLVVKNNFILFIRNEIRHVAHPKHFLMNKIKIFFTTNISFYYITKLLINVNPKEDACIYINFPGGEVTGREVCVRGILMRVV